MGFIHRIPDSVRKIHVTFYGSIFTLTHPYQNAPLAAATGYPAVSITSHTFSKSFARLSIRHRKLRYVFYDISATALSVSDSTKFFFVHVWLCWHRCALIQTGHTLILFRIVSVAFASNDVSVPRRYRNTRANQHANCRFVFTFRHFESHWKIYANRCIYQSSFGRLITLFRRHVVWIIPLQKILTLKPDFETPVDITSQGC